MDKIWEETLARIDELEKQVKNLQNSIVPDNKAKSESVRRKKKKPGQKTE